MTNKTLEAKIKQYSDIDAEAVSDAVDFLRRGTRGRSVSESIDMWANIDRVIYRELVRRWNASEPVHAAETFAGSLLDLRPRTPRERERPGLRLGPVR